MKKYDSLDLLKFIMCLMIVAIHTQLFPMILYPWLRLAVPLFFITSSFLLYNKIKMNKNQEKEIIKKYVIRQLKFYLFWFIILLPITIYFRLEWFGNGLLVGIIRTITNTLFSSTFIASWFIVACFEGVIIFSILSKKIGKKFLFVGLILYFICCFKSSYFTILDDSTIIYKLVFNYERFMPSFVFSFPVALIYIFIGKVFSEKEDKIMITIKDYIALIFSCLLLFIEWKFCYELTGTYNNDCYFMILPCTYFIFKICVSLKLDIKNAKSLRMFSIISFPLHASIQFVNSILLNHFINNTNICTILNFILTIICCFIVYMLITKLEKNKKFYFLKFSH